MFSLGEEFGWRGFAYPRLERLYGPVMGSLVLGSVWGLWHIGMMFSPEPLLHALPFYTVFIHVGELAFWSVVIAWMFERGNRSIAIAIHAGEHIDNVSRAPETQVRLRVLRFVILAIVAAFAARSLMKRKRAVSSERAMAAT
jgi:F0F1-type ATP synthase membrane subunit c/vacuolar-type H+-ATPase subunit K